MQQISTLLRDRMMAFFLGTIALQTCVLISGVYFKFSLPELSVLPSGDYEVAASDFGQDEYQTVFNLGAANSLESIEDPGLAFEAVETEVEEDLDADVGAASSVVSYTVKRGDTLTRIWQRHKAKATGAILAAKAFKRAGISLSELRVGDQLELQISNEGDITGFRKKLRDGRVMFLDGNSQNGYHPEIVEPEIVESERMVSGSILSSFSAAAAQSDVPYGVVDQLVDLFGGRLEFRRDLHRGDTFAVIYTERHLRDGQRISPGPIAAASLKTGGKFLVAVRYAGKDGKGHYYDEKGQPLGNFFLRYPLKFSRISSVFSKSRFHPVLKRHRPHNGTDFAAPIGTPVRTVADGVVQIAAYKGGNGNMIKINHGPRYATAYLHLNRINKGIRPGVKVTRGQVIGTVGKTGLATGPHLHFSFYDRGRYVDPLKVKLPQMPTKFEPIPVSFLESTLARLKASHNAVRLASLPATSETGLG